VKLTDYPQVDVIGAPGFTDFQGYKIWEGDAPAGRRAVVCAEWEGKIETYVFDFRYVSEA
jgi:hypothetical protein